MSASPAPMRIAILRPSPVLVGTDAERASGPRTNARTSSGSHSNPPVAMITPRRAPMSTEPSLVSKRTPTTRPSSTISSTARMPVRGSIWRSKQARSSGPMSPCPAPRSSRTDRHPVLPVCEIGIREQRAFERPAAPRLRTRVLGVVVREILDDLELDRRVRLEPRHHLRSGIDQRCGAVGLDEAVRERVQIRKGLFPAVLDAELGHVRIDGDPHHPAGPRARATHCVGLLEQADTRASVRGPYGGGESRRSGAQHDNVERLHGTPRWLAYI